MADRSTEPSPKPERAGGAPVWVAPLVIAALALLVRWVYYQQVRSLLLFTEPTGDAAWYVQLATRIAREGFWAPAGQAYFQAPLYPWFLSLLGGSESLVLARAVQWAGGVLGALLAWDTARRLAGPGAGLAAGLLAALYGPRLFFEGELLSSALGLLFLQVVIWLMLWDDEPPTLSRAGLAGACASLAALAQPNALLVGAGLLLLAGQRALLGPVAERNAWRRAGAALAVAHLLLLGPVLLRNHAASGDWVLISSNGGVNFFLGNNPDADGTFHLPAGEPLQNDNDGLLVSSTEAVRSAIGGTPGPAAVSGWWMRRGLAFWIADPLAALGLTARKLLYFLNAAELPNHYAIDFFRERVPILRILPGFLLLGPLALWGLWRLWRQRQTRALHVAALTYAASVVFFFVTDRYRLPVIAAFLPAAGVAIVDLGAIARRRRPGESTVAVVSLALLVTLAAFRFVDLSPGMAHMHNLLGSLYYRQGQMGAARQEFEEALRVRPNQPEALNNLGRTELLAGQVTRAETLFRQAIEVEPRRPEAWLNLEEVLRNRAEWSECLRLLGRMQAQVPGALKSFGPAILFRQGLAHQALGDTATARAELTGALRAKPDLAGAWAALAGLDRAAGRLAVARAGFSRAAQLAPEYFGHPYNLGLVLEEMGDNAGALSAYRQAGRVAPNESEPAYRAALVAEKLGQVEPATAAFRALAARNFGPALYQIGRLAEIAGQPREAIDAYRRALGSRGTQLEIRLAAARLAALEGKP